MAPTDLWAWMKDHLVDALDIYIIAYLIYRIILMLRGTRAVRILFGLVVMILSYFISQRLGLVATSWLLGNFLLYAVLIVVIIFQNEIRRALWEFGRTPHWFDVGSRSGVQELEEIIQGVHQLASRRVGALVAIERSVGLRDYVEAATTVDAKVSKELLASIFHPTSPLHDGAVIVQKRRLAAAGCLLPLSHAADLDPVLGTRHRAALGLAEETDAIVVVVSEETGTVSLAVDGELRRNLEAGRLRDDLYRLLTEPVKKPVKVRSPEESKERAGSAESGPLAARTEESEI
ncbi:MAG: TIGR00159 family protein [Nitrospirae bacterium]|nr:TIGR00159 family protein [Nitrospirota bacterium]